MSNVTEILSQIESGDPSSSEQLLPLVYDELRKLGAAKLAQEKPGQTLYRPRLEAAHRRTEFIPFVPREERNEFPSTIRGQIGQT